MRKFFKTDEKKEKPSLAMLPLVCPVVVAEGKKRNKICHGRGWDVSATSSALNKDHINSVSTLESQKATGNFGRFFALFYAKLYFVLMNA